MPINMTVMATMPVHARRNAAANLITETEIAERLRRKGYTRPDRAIRKYLGSDGWMPNRMVEAIFELIDEQDAGVTGLGRFEGKT